MVDKVHRINLPINMAGFNKNSYGYHHDIYTIRDINNDYYILKYAEKDTQSVNRLRNEKNAINELRKTNLKQYIPKLKHDKLGVKNGYLLYRYYNNEMLNLSNDNYVVNFIKNLAKFLKQLHNLKIPSKYNDWVDNSPTFNNWINKFKSETINLISQDKKFKNYTMLVENNVQKIKDNTKLNISLIHNDIRLSNIIYDSKGNIKKVIDWENLTALDPAYEIARVETMIFNLYYVFTNYTYDKLIKLFRNEYKIPKQLKNRIDLYKPIYMLQNMHTSSIPHTWLQRSTEEHYINTYRHTLSKIINK